MNFLFDHPEDHPEQTFFSQTDFSSLSLVCTKGIGSESGRREKRSGLNDRRRGWGVGSRRFVPHPANFVPKLLPTPQPLYCSPTSFFPSWLFRLLACLTAKRNAQRKFPPLTLLFFVHALGVLRHTVM